MFSTAEHYRRLAVEARERAAQAKDPSIKDGFEKVANDWLALAQQAEWLRQRNQGCGVEEK
jgi:hypothetical protein